MKRVVAFSASADRDFISIFDYIAARSDAEQAYRYVQRIRDACLALDTFPERGASWNHFLAGVRVVGFERRVSIVFRVKPRTVTILRVLYGGRDLNRNLDAR